MTLLFVYILFVDFSWYTIKIYMAFTCVNRITKKNWILSYQKSTVKGA